MKYQANPVVVDAIKIVEIGEVESDGSRTLTLDDGGLFEASNDQLCRMPHVAPGDYIVRQEDGYIYLNPAAVFERKYSPFVEEPPIVQVPHPSGKPSGVAVGEGLVTGGPTAPVASGSLGSGLSALFGGMF